MRKVVTGMFISLDGVTEAPDQWQETFDDDMGASMQARIDRSDAILLGRITYDFWHTYWPTSGHEPFATYINNTPKYVVSSTLDKAEWGEYENITLLNGNIVEAISKLKQEPGKDIAVEGSPSLVRFLVEHDLLDELGLMIHPVIAGQGNRLFTEKSTLKRLKLIDNKITSSGTIIATYAPIKSP